MSRHVVIVGEMGAGKTTVGGILAAELDVPLLDSDVQIESTTGDTAAAIAEREGVESLHAIELSTFVDMCRAERRSVIAPAASVLDHEEGRTALSQHTVVWLTASEDTIARRQGKHRRTLGSTERDALRARREPHYEQVAGLTLDTSDTTPDAIARIIDEWLAS